MQVMCVILIFSTVILSYPNGRKPIHQNQTIWLLSKLTPLLIQRKIGLSFWDWEGVLGLSFWDSERALGLSFWDSEEVLGLSFWDSKGVLGLSFWDSEGVLGLSFWDSEEVLGLSFWDTPLSLPDASHEFQIHVSVRILTIKLNQWARVNFCSYRKKHFRGLAT